MIYLDTSVVLAQLLAEDRRPPEEMWLDTLVTSRLTQYEVWVRIHSMELGSSHGEATRELLSRLAFLELSPIVLERAVEPFPTRVRTLDALHLASIDYLRSQRLDVRLASYDDRMLTAARRMGVAIDH